MSQTYFSVRFSGRRREIALRMAIGASRTSIIRLFVFESLLVSILAGLAGAFLAWQLVPVRAKNGGEFSSVRSRHARGAFASRARLHDRIVDLDRSDAMGIYPALQSSRADLVDGLKEGGRGTSGSAAATTLPQNFGRRAGRAFCHSAGRRGAAHHQFCSIEPARHWISAPKISGSVS